jgi:hypothetical protein
MINKGKIKSKKKKSFKKNRWKVMYCFQDLRKHLAYHDKKFQVCSVDIGRSQGERKVSLEKE